MFSNKPKYEPVPSYEEDGNIPQYRRPSKQSSLISLAIQICILSMSLVFFLCGLIHWESRTARLTEFDATYSPAKEAVEYNSGFFSQAWLDDSVFKGTPRPELEDAWDYISGGDVYPGPTLSISEEELDKIGKSSSRDTTARLPPEVGGGYMASLEVFHQLHCLNMLRMITYQDHYPEMGEPWLRNHIDHCIEMIRQRLMCTADIGIITGNWVNHYGEPYPDFRTQHQCRNFEKIHQWAKDHEVKVTMKEIVAQRGPYNLTRPPVQDVE